MHKTWETLLLGKKTSINDLMSIDVVTLRGVGVNLVCMYELSMSILKKCSELVVKVDLSTNFD